MSINLKGKNFLTLLDFLPEEINYLLELALKLKKENLEKREHQHIYRKNIALIFDEQATRSRTIFEVAAYDQGAHVTYISSSELQLLKAERISDTAKLLGRLYDGIAVYGIKHSDAELLAKNLDIPIWNGLTDKFYPVQALADLMTIKENFSELKNLKLVFYGETKNAISNSLMIGAAQMGMHYVVCGPKNIWPEENILSKCKEIAKSTKAIIELNEQPIIAAKNADVFYTNILLQTNDKEIVKQAKKNAIFLYCLPNFYNGNSETKIETNNEIFDLTQTKVFDQAENCLHIVKSIMIATIKE